MSSELDFGSLAVVELPVKINGEEFVLREISGGNHVKYKEAQFKCRHYSADGKTVTYIGLSELEPLLVHLCLFYKNSDKHVEQDKIGSWPARVQKKLFEKAREISLLKEESPEKRALKAVLAREDCPYDADEFEKYILSLEGDVYKPLQEWCKPENEEVVKN